MNLGDRLFQHFDHRSGNSVRLVINRLRNQINLIDIALLYCENRASNSTPLLLTIGPIVWLVEKLNKYQQQNDDNYEPIMHKLNEANISSILLFSGPALIAILLSLTLYIFVPFC